MKFIDLFAGIGGFHIALSRLDMECVFASEIDEYARSVYLKNFNFDESIFNKDIRSIAPEQIPDHDILCAGFPCQPFSQAGYKRGFEDVHKSERGNLFYYIADIIETKQPKAFILENVRHLLNHDNGKTFQIIRNILEKDLNYTVYFKIIKASDFGRPQHRPRIYIIGFNNRLINTFYNFDFPEPTGLKMTMSDIWEGKCSRDIGFTLRVGGKGSPIEDRRNWDGYIVDGKEVRLSPKQGKRMMGYPDDFELSPTKTQAMKQLGNSVCVDVVYHLGLAVQGYLKKHQLKEQEVMVTFNKGEWSELYAFLKMIAEPKLHFGDNNLNILSSNEYATVFSLQHNNGLYQYVITNGQLIISSKGSFIKEYNIASLFQDNRLDSVLESISNEIKTFNFQDAELIENLKIQRFKGNSWVKQDINVGFDYKELHIENDPLGIKSFLGATPTLLNASSNTNFIYRVDHFEGSVDDVNQLQTSKRKVQDKIRYILDNGGNFQFQKCEKKVFQDNLSLVDGDIPQIISNILLRFYSGQGSKVSELVTEKAEVIKIKRLLEIILLGMFPSKEWDGLYTANGVIIVRKEGDLLLYHMLKKEILNDYLFLNTKLDTPSTSRHGFGYMYKEDNYKYFKLNLQIRNI